MNSKVIGITGFKYSGKSTVGSIFRRHYIPTIDLDEICYNVIKPGTAGFNSLLNYLGTEIIDDNADIDMQKLTILSCKQSWIRELLDDILESELDEFFGNLKESLPEYKVDIFCVECSAILNTRLRKHVNKFVLIDSDEEIRRDRLKKYLGLPDIVLEKFIKSNSKFNTNEIDFTINNNSSIEDLEKKVKDLIPDIILKVC